MQPIFGVRFNEQERMILKDVSTHLRRKQGDTLRFLLFQAYSDLRKVEDNSKAVMDNYLATTAKR